MTPPNSTGCPIGQYVAGESLSPVAARAELARCPWTGTDNDATTSSTNSLTMPAASHDVSVVYVQLPMIVWRRNSACRNQAMRHKSCWCSTRLGTHRFPYAVTEDGSATAGADYTALDREVTFSGLNPGKRDFVDPR
ncbi:MAG: hypothetical protein R2854_20085 [Caldilineaceae bacterium]